MKRILISIVYSLFIAYNINAQVYSVDKVDEILAKSNQEFIKLNFFESIKLSNSAFKISHEIDYSKGVTLSSIYLAKNLLELGDFKKSLFYITKAENEVFFKSYLNVQIESYRLKGRIYGNLEMNILAEKEFKKQLLNSKKIEDTTIKNLATFWAYQNINYLYNKTNKKDSLKKYLNIQEIALKNFDEKTDYLSIIVSFPSLELFVNPNILFFPF